MAALASLMLVHRALLGAKQAEIPGLGVNIEDVTPGVTPTEGHGAT